MSHHPSCKPSDKSLTWLCDQCGEREDASSVENALADRDAEIKAMREDNGRQVGEWTVKYCEMLDQRNDAIKALRVAVGALTAIAEPGVYVRDQITIEYLRSILPSSITAWWEAHDKRVAAGARAEGQFGGYHEGYDDGYHNAEFKVKYLSWNRDKFVADAKAKALEAEGNVRRNRPTHWRWNRTMTQENGQEEFSREE